MLRIVNLALRRDGKLSETAQTSVALGSNYILSVAHAGIDCMDFSAGIGPIVNQWQLYVFKNIEGRPLLEVRAQRYDDPTFLQTILIHEKTARVLTASAMRLAPALA